MSDFQSTDDVRQFKQRLRANKASAAASDAERAAEAIEWCLTTIEQMGRRYGDLREHVDEIGREIDRQLDELLDGVVARREEHTDA